MKKSLGSINALAALCALSTDASAAVTLSTTIDNSPIVTTSNNYFDPVSVSFDINGDATDDFSISKDLNSADLVLTSLNGTLFLDPGVVGGYIGTVAEQQVLTVGDQTTSGPLNLHNDLDGPNSLITGESFYFGLIFNAGSGVQNLAWIEVNSALSGSPFYDISSDSVTAVRAQWQSTPAANLTVPEPSAAVFALAGLLSLGYRRRRDR